MIVVQKADLLKEVYIESLIRNPKEVGFVGYRCNFKPQFLLCLSNAPVHLNHLKPMPTTILMKEPLKEPKNQPLKPF